MMDEDIDPRQIALLATIRTVLAARGYQAGDIHRPGYVVHGRLYHGVLLGATVFALTGTSIEAYPGYQAALVAAGLVVQPIPYPTHRFGAGTAWFVPFPEGSAI